MSLAHIAAVVGLPFVIAPLVLASAQAAELQPPVTLNTPGIPTDASPGATNPPGSSVTCPPLAPPTGPVQPGRLVIRESDRPDVGPYTVTLPGYGTDPNSADQDLYRPFLATVPQGSTLRLDLVNQLPDAADHGGVVNLHTHGLVTSPRPCTPLSDNVFVHTLPGNTTSYRMDIPATLPGLMFGSDPAPRPYPSGLQWFHAHVHGKAKDDVRAGQSGMLYVGDLLADLLATPGLDPASADALGRTDVLTLGLRDIQLAVPSGSRPDNAGPGQRGRWLQGAEYDDLACSGFATTPQPFPSNFAGPGYCGHPGATIGGAGDLQQDTVWLFTVNGQHDATITMQPGRHQIWRIANLSSSLTYLLELTDDASGQPETLRVLSLDGLVAGTSVPGNTALSVGIGLNRLQLMPASRAEVFVANAGDVNGRRLTLRTAGITTGPSGNNWPRVDLAHVAMPPAAAGAATAAVGVTLPNAATAAATPVSAASSAAVPANCVALPADGRATRRRITFSMSADRKDFQLGSEVVDVDGAPIDNQHTIPAQPFPAAAMLAPGSVPHVCPRLGTQEVWELVNRTSELHNFHLHQTKFRLTREGDPGAPSNLPAVADPIVPGADAALNVDVWHDVLPVPSQGGRVFVTIPFYAPQQVGFFPYHCHILRHEDAGMMAVTEVYDPAQTAANDDRRGFASVVRGAMCGLPPADLEPASFSGRILDTVRSLAAAAFGSAAAAVSLRP